MGICLAFAVASTAAAESMEPPVLVMYEKVGMSGRQIVYDAAVEDIDVRYPFHSATVKSGRWELCTRNDFKGACIDLGPGDEIASLKKEFGLFARVRSLRPVEQPPRAAAAAPAMPEIVSAPAVNDEAGDGARAPGERKAPAASAEAVLRGHHAHFFKTPMLDGAPIDADDAAAASAFCREAGFGQVEFSAPAARGGRPIVGDLLCGGPLGGGE